jgi:hypothetical protein
LSIKTVIVDLESINIPPQTGMDKSSLIALANSIIQLQGIVRPPILRSIGIDEYEVVAGQSDFHGYLQARQMDPSLPDRLTVFVIDKKNEAAVQQQLAVYAQPTTMAPSSSSNSSFELSNLEAKLDRLFAAQGQSINSLEQALVAKLNQSLPQPLPMLVAFDRIQEPAIALQITKNLAFLGDAKVKKLLQLLQAAKKKGQSLTSIAAVQVALTEVKSGKNTKLIGDKKMIELLDRWNQ